GPPRARRARQARSRRPTGLEWLGQCAVERARCDLRRDAGWLVESHLEHVRSICRDSRLESRNDEHATVCGYTYLREPTMGVAGSRFGDARSRLARALAQE